MEFALLNQYVVVTIFGICLCLGYVIKTSLKFINKQYIPLIMLVTGTALNVAFHIPHITLEVILAGMVSGLASTGGYEVVHQFIKNSGNSKGAEGIEGAPEDWEASQEEEDNDASN